MSALRSLFDQAMQLEALAFRMKQTGISIDQKARLAHSERLAIIVEKSRIAFQTLAQVELPDAEEEDEDEGDSSGADTLLGSVPQLLDLFYRRWGCRVRTNPKTGKPTIDKNVLKDLLATGGTEQIRTGARLLLTYREASKTKGTYVDRLDPENRGRNGEPNSYLTTGDGILHPTWQVVHAQTGRWSCSGPNLQNIQKPVAEKNNEGKTIILRAGMRDMFVSRAGQQFIEGDYSQLELRCIAVLAGDPVLLELLATEGVDIHFENGKVLFNTSSPSKGERDLAKIFVYGTQYGGSAKTIWKQMVVKFPRLTETDILRMQDRWFKAHPWIVAFQKDSIRQAKETGKVIEVLSGREFIFYLGQVKPTEPANYRVQGMAASLMNTASVKIDQELRWDANEAMLAQIHDAAMLEGPDVGRLGRVLRNCMETEVTLNGLTAKFPIDLKAGPVWGTMEAIK